MMSFKRPSDPRLATGLLLIFLAVPPAFAGQLHDAAEAGDGEILERLIRDGAAVNEPDSEGITPLHYAAYRGHLSAVKTLLDNGADPELAAPPIRRRALHVAAMEGHLPVVRALLEHGARLEPLDDEGVPPLGLAVAVCRPEVAELLIQSGANVNRRFHDGTTYLHGLAYAGNADRHRDMAELLIGAGAEVDAATRNEGNTPLHIAAQFGDYDTVQVLLDAGADLERGNAYQDRALHNAAVTGQHRIVSLLIARGASLDAADASGMTALHWAVGEGKRTKRGPSMLEFVTWKRGGSSLPHDFVATAATLIEHGASLDTPDRKGRTPVKLAKKRGNPRMVALFEAQAPR